MKKYFVVAVALCISLTVFGCSSVKKEDPFDYERFPFYDPAAQNMSYSYTEEQRAQPFWLGNVIFNELVMIMEDGGVVKGKLMFPARKVISVRDYTLEQEFIEGEDYTLSSDGEILWKEGSAMPVFDQEWLCGKNIPEPYEQTDDAPQVANDKYVVWGTADNPYIYTESGLIYKNYVSVTYEYDLQLVDQSVFAQSSPYLSAVRGKMEAGEDIKLTVLGDSISQGCSCSEFFGREPYCPPYANLVAEGLERRYGIDVALTNLSLGGTTTSWGMEQVAAVKATSPDLVILGFGMNDVTSGLSRITYKNNIEDIISNIQAENPECQFIVLHTFPPNPLYASDMKFNEYFEQLQKLEGNGVCVVNLWEIGKSILKIKEYCEISANNVNHPNDFFTRIYAMDILTALGAYAAD